MKKERIKQNHNEDELLWLIYYHIIIVISTRIISCWYILSLDVIYIIEFILSSPNRRTRDWQAEGNNNNTGYAMQKHFFLHFFFLIFCTLVHMWQKEMMRPGSQEIPRGEVRGWGRGGENTYGDWDLYFDLKG